MTYEQSLENVEILKNLALPLDAYHIFFDFENNTEFKMLFFDGSESKDYISDLMRSKFKNKLPIARIQIHLDHEMFYYEDCHIRYNFDFTTQEVTMNDSKISFRNSSPAEIAIEMNKLLLKLKNM